MTKRALDAKDLQIKELQEVCELQDQKIKSLERKEKTRLVWVISNFANERKQKFLRSNAIDFAGYRWFIGIYPDNEGFVSAYLFLEDDFDRPPKKFLTISYSLRFVNYLDPLESYKKEFEKLSYPPKGDYGYGDPRAIKTSRITEDNGFLKDNTFTIEAEIFVTDSHWIVTKCK